MPKLIPLIIIAICTSACIAEPLPSDPYSLAQYGAGLQTQADTLLLSTDQAAILEAHALAMQSTGTAAAWQIQATQTIASGQVQQTEQAQAIAGTAHIIQLAATDNAGRVTQTVEAVHYVATIEAAGATATAIALAVEHEREMLRVRTAWVGVREAAYSLFVVCVLAATGWGLWRGVPWLAAWLVEWTDRRRSLFETRQGTAVYTDDGVQLLGDIYHNRPRQAPVSQVEPVTLSAGGVTAESKPAGHNQVEAEALYLLKRCQPDSDVIVSDDKATMSARAWTRATDAMQQAGLIEKRAGVGTRVIDGRMVGDVIYALETGQVKLEIGE